MIARGGNGRGGRGEREGRRPISRPIPTGILVGIRKRISFFSLTRATKFGWLRLERGMVGALERERR